MNAAIAILVGGLFASGFYMMLRRSSVKVVIGLVLMSHAANLLVFTAAGLERGAPPLVPEGALVAPPGSADPLAQALVLTAIVISFGILAFTVTLIVRMHRVTKTDDVDALREE